MERNIKNAVVKIWVLVMKNNLKNFKVGDWVKVKKGIVVPDNPEYCIENWKGKIIKEFSAEADELVVLIKWDSQTLKKMPTDFIKECIHDGLEFSEMGLGINEIECTEPGDYEEDPDKMIQALISFHTESLFIKRDENSKYYDEQEQRIVKILDGVDIENEEKVTEKWAKYLDVNLEFPFKAEVIDIYRNIKGLDVGDVVNVKKIEGIHDSYGVVVEVRKRLRNYDLPLSDLEVCVKNSKNYNNVDDYNFWFENK